MARPTPSIEDSKRDASLLLKDLRSIDHATACKAAERFRRLTPFKPMTTECILQDRDAIQRKHALDVVAREQGYLNWKKLKDASDVFWCPPGSSAFWHNWCKSHSEARSYLEAKGGYLLPAHGKCFIAEAGYIEFLGLDPEDPRWKDIGHDVVEPHDVAVRDALVDDLKAVRSERATK